MTKNVVIFIWKTVLWDHFIMSLFILFFTTALKILSFYLAQNFTNYHASPQPLSKITFALDVGMFRPRRGGKVRPFVEQGYAG